MASGISSLFGPSAEELMYAQQQENVKRQQQQLQQGLAVQSSPLAQQFYQSGYNIASGLGNLFGSAPMADPRLARSIKSRQIMSDISAEDLNDPDKLKLLSQQFTEAQMPEAALYFADRENTIRVQDRDYVLDLAKAKASSAFDIENTVAFMKQVEAQTKNPKEDLEKIADARELLRQAKAGNDTARASLNRYLIGLTRDSQIGMSELQQFVGGGSLGERIKNSMQLYFVGTEIEGKYDDKEAILNALELNRRAVLEKKYKNLKTGFQQFVPKTILDSYTSNEDNKLSRAANNWLTSIEDRNKTETPVDNTSLPTEGLSKNALQYLM